MDQFPKKIIFSGCVLAGMTLAMGWGGLSIIINGEIGKQMRLINGTDTYRYWQKVAIPVSVSIYIFNLTNPEEVANGAKPVLMQTGPYVYKENLYKDATEDNVINETLRYRQIRTYYFDPDASKGTEEDMIVMINEPLVAIGKALNDFTKDSSVIQKADAWLAEKGEKVTMTRPVREWLFGEYSVQNFVDLANETLITSIGELKLNEHMEDGMFSAVAMSRKNNSDGGDGEWLIQTGRNKSIHFGKVVGWNGYEEYLPYYKGDPCNAINGTDGHIFHPFIMESTPMHMFASELCRSVKLIRGEPMEMDLISFYRYNMDPNTLMGSSKNPDNWCFCPDDDSSKCEQRNGIHKTDICLDGFPRSISLPHFLGADDEIINAVDGMKPNKEMHETYLDIHELSGIVLKSSKKLQFNLELMPYPNMPSLSKVPTVTLPMLWLDETLDAHHLDILMLQIIKAIETAWENIRWGLLGIAAILVFIGIATALTRRSSKVERVTLIQ